MKKKTLLRYGNCLLAAILSVIAFQANAETFTSLPAGGKWHEAATWDKGKAPTNNDDVVIASRVESVSSYLTTHHLTIRPEGQLTGSAWVTVNGNFVNNGDFSGEKSNYFRLLVRGNFENNGSLFMGWVDLQGGDKNIKITQAMQIDYLEVEMDQGSRLTAISDLTFCNTRVRQEKEGVRLVMGSHSLTIKSDKLTYDNYYALFGIPGALMITTEFDDGGRIILDKGMLYNYAGRTAIYGDVVIESPSVAFFSKNLQFFGNLTIAEGTTLVGDKSLGTTTTVYGDIINYGNICGDPFIVVDDIQSKANAMEFVVYGNAYNYGRFGYIKDRNTFFNKLVLVTDGETRRLSGFFNSLLDFRQSADNKTQPGGKVVIDEEIETVKMLELYAPMEITPTGKLHINVALHSPLRINKTLGGSIKNEGIYSYWLSPSMSFYGFKGKEEYGMNITISAMSGEGERSIEVTEYEQQTYPGLPGTVKRWWRISNREGYEHTTAVMRFYYDDALLNGQPEEKLKVFQSIDEGETWKVISVGDDVTHNREENYIEVGYWARPQSHVKGVGDFIISSGDGSVPLESNLHVELIGREDIRVGAPNPFTVRVTNLSDTQRNDLCFLSIHLGEDLRFDRFEIPNFEGSEIIDATEEQADELDAVFLIPYLDPGETGTLQMVIHALPDGLRSGKPENTELFATLIEAVHDPEGWVTEKVAEKIDLDEDERKQYADALGLTVNQTRKEKEDKGSWSYSLKYATKRTITKIMDTMPGGALINKIGTAIDIIGEIGPSLRQRFYYWAYKETGLISDKNLKVSTGATVRGHKVTSWDPNEKVGPSGYGEQNHIRYANGRVSYTIFFENKAEATAAAYRVQIEDLLSDVFDPATVEFEGSSHEGEAYNWECSRSGNTLKWDIKGIELPPNQTPPEGEGWVRFSVRLKEGLSSGTKIENKATIIFDMNEPIVTNTYTNIIDLQPPVTAFDEVKYDAEAKQLRIRCHADDGKNGSGIRDYQYFVSIDEGPFQLIGQTYEEELLYDVDGNEHAYRFYVIATDNVGNQETAINALSNPYYTSMERIEAIENAPTLFPNPVQDVANIAFSLDAVMPVTIELYQANGALLYRQPLRDIRQGNNLLQLDMEGYATGNYYVRLVMGGTAKTLKLIKR